MFFTFLVASVIVIWFGIYIAIGEAFKIALFEFLKVVRKNNEEKEVI